MPWQIGGHSLATFFHVIPFLRISQVTRVVNISADLIFLPGFDTAYLAQQYSARGEEWCIRDSARIINRQIYN
jgi:hypothetical protein